MKEKQPKSNSLKFLLIITFLILLAGVLIWRVFYSYHESWPREIKENYVAVLPFKNNTGDPELDVIGEMAADWITSGLHETGEGKILAASDVSQINERNQFTQNPSLPSDNGRFHIPYLIEGSYYKLNDEFIFSSSIKDLSNGEIVFTFPMSEEKSIDPMIAIESLKQRILGYWVTKDRIGYERKPPVYEAYQAYLEAGKVWDLNPQKAGVLLRKSIEVDSNLHYAAFGLAHNLINRGRLTEADSVIDLYESKKNILNPMELEFLNGLRARSSRNINQTWRHWQSPYISSYWGRSHTLKQRVNILLWDFNQPQKALDLMKDIDFANLDYQKERNYRSLYFRKVVAYYRLGWHKEAIELLTNIPFELEKGSNIRIKVFLLANMKAYDELEETLDYFSKSLPSDDYPKHYLQWFAIMGMQASDDSTRAKQASRDYLNYIENENLEIRTHPKIIGMDEIKLDLYLYTNQMDKAGRVIEEELAYGNDQPDFLTMAGIYFAKTGNDSAAKEIKELILANKKKYDQGRSERNIALIETASGNEDKAISLLVEARKNGARVFPYFFDGDWHLKALFNKPEFQAEVMAAFPVPEVDNTPIQSPHSPTRFVVMTILALILIGGILWFRFYKKAGISPEEKSEPNDPFLSELKILMDKHWDDSEFGLTKISEAMGLSRPQFYRKIKSITGQSPSIYIRNLRLQKAQELLKNTQLNISEVAYAVGFKDLSYFSRSFSEEFGISPSETRA